MVDHVLVKAFVVRAAKCPTRKLTVVVAERVHDHGILIGKLNTLGGDCLLDALSSLACDHQRIRRDLARIEFHKQIHVALQHFEILTTEAEDHVDIGRREELKRFLQTLVDQSAGTELVVALGHLENVVVKALYADAHAVHEPLEIAERRGGNLQRIGFARHFFDAWEKRAGVFNRADELVFENRCRAPADVHTRKVVAERFDIVHFLAQVHKVFACLVFLKQEAVEGTV